MKTARQILPDGTEHKVTARDIQTAMERAGGKGAYRKLKPVFACVTDDCAARVSFHPETIGVAGNPYGRRSAYFSSLVRGDHAHGCPYREAPSPSPYYAYGSEKFNTAVAHGARVLLYLNMGLSKGNYNFAHLQKRGIDQPAHDKDARIATWAGKYVTHSVRHVDDLIRVVAKVLELNQGNLRAIHLSQGGGLWSLWSSFDDQQKTSPNWRHRIAYDAWCSVMAQTELHPLRIPAALLPPRVVRLVPSKKQMNDARGRARMVAAGEKPLGLNPAEALRIHGHGYPHTNHTQRSTVIFVDTYRFKTKEEREAAMAALLDGQEVYVLATPTVLPRSRHEDTKRQGVYFDTELRVMGTFIGPLPLVITQALHNSDPYSYDLPPRDRVDAKPAVPAA